MIIEAKSKKTSLTIMRETLNNVSYLYLKNNHTYYFSRLTLDELSVIT